MAVAEVWPGAAKGGGRFSSVADQASAERIRSQGPEYKSSYALSGSGERVRRLDLICWRPARSQHCHRQGRRKDPRSTYAD